MKLVETLITKGRIIESEQSKLPNGVLCRGVWPICNIGLLNQNNRMYEKAVWDKVLADKGIREKMDSRTLFGQAEHPEKTQSDLQLTSHIITDMFYDSVKEGGEIIEKAFQQVDILDTPCGRIINTLIEAKCQVGVSTRAEGDLEEKEDEDGNKYHRVVPESYNYVTTDFTADPSTFNVAPVSIESSLVKDVVAAVHEKDVKKRISKNFAGLILECCKSDEGTTALKSLLIEDVCKYHGDCVCCKCGKCNEQNIPKTIEELINMEMIKLGAGVIIREGKYKTAVKGFEIGITEGTLGKITEIKEGAITIELEDGTTITGQAGVIEIDHLIITLPDAASEPTDDLEAEELEDEEGIKEPLPGEPSAESPREELPRGFESKLLPENYEHMVTWMQKRLKDIPIKDLKVFGDLVKTKILNEKITPSATAKEIRLLKIKEASSRAERDKALEMIDEIEEKLNSITEKSPLEVRILVKRLKEAKYTDVEVQALCKKLEERQTTVNEVKKQFESFKSLSNDNDKKVEENTKLLKESHERALRDLEENLNKKHKKQIVEKYVGLKLGQSGLKVHKNARALLEKCTSTEDVDEVYDDIKEAMRRSALRPNQIDEVHVQKKNDNPETAMTKSLIKNAMSGMK